MRCLGSASNRKTPSSSLCSVTSTRRLKSHATRRKQAAVGEEKKHQDRNDEADQKFRTRCFLAFLFSGSTRRPEPWTPPSPRWWAGLPRARRLFVFQDLNGFILFGHEHPNGFPGLIIAPFIHFYGRFYVPKVATKSLQFHCKRMEKGASGLLKGVLL